MQQPAPPPEVLEVREATRRDLRATAALHRRALPEGFFARLGPGFLRAYHASFVASPEAVALVVSAPDAGGDPAGFVVGTLRNRAHYRWVLRHASPRLALRLVAALVRRPRLAGVFVRTRAARYVRWVWRYPLRRAQARSDRSDPRATEPRAELVEAPTQPASKQAVPPVAVPPVAVLTHVAIDDGLRGRGAGRLLVEEFVDRARAAGANEVRLVTEASDGASSFYERLGWSAVGEHTGSDGSVVREFRWPLHPRAS
jgi:ribosomal protein S18 acetylase RimI-like enzyme